ncbi:hypothetical protein HRG_009666 [Hirsutella rhossiliensis]|uniref:LysM domain-containing protein n=1 Tax=Hirsutella rhossiliensis TaxID=111463 RepID=A0A9P8MQ60_9HYPO|nr:uncharacterized protein HRG_09666 [Hirsutella rhossiliensis]KAH0959205.1 hypothetical protein HRG_09666 [Hirsutella rhossiliensis]
MLSTLGSVLLLLGSTGLTNAAVVSTGTVEARAASPPSPLQPGIAANCNKWYMVKPHDYCAAIAAEHGISTEKFIQWNSGAGPECKSLLSGYYACVAVDSEPKPTPVKPENGIKTPSPFQAGMVKNCNKFHFVQPKQTCLDVERATGAKVADLIKWNPAIGHDCTTMWAKTHLCVGVVG